MARYGYRKTPDLVVVAALASAGPFVVGMIRSDTPENRDYVVGQLALEDRNGYFGGIPSETLGRWSKWNITGRSIPRRDLPMVQKTWSTESPNFGDWSRGSHTNGHSRMVFQREQLYGQQLEARIESVQVNGRQLLICTVQRQFPAGSADSANLLYAASLSREWFGSATVLVVNQDGVAEVPTQHVPWEIFPLDHLAGDVKTWLRGHLHNPMPEPDLDLMAQRYGTVRSLGPTDMVVGNSGFQRYFGFKFGDDFVAFENLRFGNALYVMYENWAELSQLTRTELLAHRRGEYTRIVHTANWQAQLAQEVRSYRARS